MKIKAEDIVFWILIAAIVAVALWLLHGSPTPEGAIVSVALFAAGSIIMIWKHVFSIDKKTAVSFVKMKNSLDKNTLILRNDLEKNTLSLKNDFNYKFDTVNEKLDGLRRSKIRIR